MRFSRRDIFRRLLCQSAVLGLLPAASLFASTPDFEKEIKPLLVNYCFDCHGDGMDKGGVSLDSFASNEEMLADRAIWLRVLKNTRADIMPPAKEGPAHPRGRGQNPSMDQIRRFRNRP